MVTSNASSSIMEQLLNAAGDIVLPKPGEFIDGKVIQIQNNRILVDLGGITTGIISGKESHDSAGTVKTLQLGDQVTTYILDEENEDGLAVLSLRKASQQKTWERFIHSYDNNEAITVTASEANKGGLLLNIDGIKGFIPVSQLAPLHYPRVNGADSGQILVRLQKLIGVPLLVKILNLDKESGKLILSERAAELEERASALEKLEVGQKIKGKISGIVNFGIFVTFEGLEGLVHISEIAWGHVKDPNHHGKLGDKLEVLVIGKENDKISLSMKRLTPDPWVEATKKYKVGNVIKGEINRITPFGAFVKLDDEINGLIHVSEISETEISDPSEVLKVGDTIEAKIINIDPDEHRVGLSINAMTAKAEAKKEKAEAKEEKAEEEMAEETKEEVAEKAEEEVAEAKEEKAEEEVAEETKEEVAETKEEEAA